jgi:hypothetical protein
MDKERLKKAGKRIGLDALGVLLCGGVAYLAGGLIPAIHGLEVFLGVTAGIYLWPSVIKLIDKEIK